MSSGQAHGATVAGPKFPNPWLVRRIADVHTAKIPRRVHSAEPPDGGSKDEAIAQTIGVGTSDCTRRRQARECDSLDQRNDPCQLTDVDSMIYSRAAICSSACSALDATVPHGVVS